MNTQALKFLTHIICVTVFMKLIISLLIHPVNVGVCWFHFLTSCDFHDFGWSTGHNDAIFVVAEDLHLQIGIDRFEKVLDILDSLGLCPWLCLDFLVNWEISWSGVGCTCMVTCFSTLHKETFMDSSFGVGVWVH